MSCSVGVSPAQSLVHQIRFGSTTPKENSYVSGLRPPPGLSDWQRVWWWFDFVILVKLARLRFVFILIVIGLLITQWDLLTAYYTHPFTGNDVQYHPTVAGC